MTLDDWLTKRLSDDALKYDNKSREASQQGHYLDKQIYRFLCVYASEVLRDYRDEKKKLGRS